MEVKSKYERGDSVWFPYDKKYFEGKIKKIVSWEYNKGFLYEITYDNIEENISFSDNFYEDEIYKFEDKEKIINDIFIYSYRYTSVKAE